MIKSLLTPFIVPPEVKNFSTNRVFMDRPSEESDAAWEMLGGRKCQLYLMGMCSDANESIAPRDHRGFIFVENLEAYGLGSQRSDNGKKMYGVSMLHQLHCLVRSEVPPQSAESC